MVGLFLNLASPVVPDLTTAVGIRRAPSRAVLPPIWHGTTAGAVLPLHGAVLPLMWISGTTAEQARYYRWMPSSIVSYHMLIHLCCVYLVLIVSTGCFLCPCVWFQMMNILSSKSAVSTPGVQHRSGTAHLRLQVVLPVLHSRQGVLPQVLILLARRRLPADQSQVAGK